jgi:hypothetical protein
MNKFSLMLLLFLGGASLVSSQTVITGKVFDRKSKEPLIGATITYAPGKGAIADLDGNYQLNLPPGNYDINFRFVGYEPVVKEVSIPSDGDKIELNVAMAQSVALREVEITADIAKDRETPIAFSSIKPKQIEEELASQDIPMILNYTPGVYATQQGGGDGDARINIRGFSQRNIAVMIDGIPVNDMQNRQVYWSNWFGLDMVTETIQVQRGLSASKLALPSIGGTLNIITKGIDSERSTMIRQEFGSGNFTRTSFMHNTGRFGNGWGLTVAGSYKVGDGLVDATFTEGFFYYLKAEKIFDKHRISFTAFGAPQRHGSRSNRQEIGMLDKDYARDIGIADTTLANMPEYGRYYNEHWGVYEDYEMRGVSVNPPPPPFPASADYYEITARGKLHTIYERVNFYHKPQLVLRHFWQINNRLNLSSSAYASIGRGGGTSLDSRSGLGFDIEGRINFQEIYERNIQAPDRQFTDFLSIDTMYSDTEIQADNFMRANRNDHFWTGFLSQANYTITENFNFAAGVDLRYYKGTQSRRVDEFVGGSYAVTSANPNKPERLIREGDIFELDEDGIVAWGGVFAELEFKSEDWTAVVNATVSTSGFKAIDRFRERQLEVGDTILSIGYSDVIDYQGVEYDRNSAGLRDYETDWETINGYTIKAGVNYNINDNMNVFLNGGIMSIAPVFDNVINRNNDFFESFLNEEVDAIELGYQYADSKFAVNVNGYYTVWGNRPISRNVLVNYPGEAVNGDIGEDTFVFIRSIDALHRGIEVDAQYVLNPKLSFQAIVSVGNWTWESEEEVNYVQAGLVLVDADGEPLTFLVDPQGVRVGDAAQTQLGGAIEFNPVKWSYIRLRGTYFGQNYSNFAPESSTGINAGRQSWQMPDYTMFDLHAGYTFNLDDYSLRLGASCFNLFDIFYISDAQNNDTFTRFTNTQNFDATSAGVFPGLGRRFNLNLTLKF